MKKGGHAYFAKRGMTALSHITYNQIMNHFYLHLLTAAMALTVTACGGNRQGPCTLTVTTPYGKYQSAALLDGSQKQLEAETALTAGTVTFSRDDADRMPYIATVQVMNPADSLDVLEMPVVIEAGEVTLELGPSVSLSGTADNRAMYRFLRDKAKFDATYSNPEMDVKKLHSDYSAFYRDRILENADNPVGRYIYDTYGAHLLTDDREQVEEKLK